MTAPRFAATTNYRHLYEQDSYGHAAVESSFDVERVTPLLAKASTPYGKNVLDIGGGNGLLGQQLASFGVDTVTIDADKRDQPNFLRFDLACYDAVVAVETRNHLKRQLGEQWLATCFDVAEHIDIEDLPAFLLNLSALVLREGIVSISTRPSSWGNRFHPSVLPVETWTAMLELAGFVVSARSDFEELRRSLRFAGASEQLVAVSHWQRLNPFCDHPSHQHFLGITRRPDVTLKEREFSRAVRVMLDTEYRSEKRAALDVSVLPPLIYNVNFIQDWSFVRSLMDVWPAEHVHLIMRSDLIAEPFLHLLKNYCERAGLDYSLAPTVADSIPVIDRVGSLDNALFMTATEGVVSIPHLMNSRLVLEARRRGATTLCIQHGMNVLRSFTPASAFVGTWDEDSAHALRALRAGDAPWDAVCTGSPKFLDALLPASPQALSHRLGFRVAGFERTILIGLSTHWNVHSHGVDETYQWMERLLERNPSTLFLLRPHFNDATIYERSRLLERPNLLLIDELLLLSIDWPIGRVLRAVDGVITTFSTLIIDALAAEKPVVLLGWHETLTQDASVWLPLSLPVSALAPTLNESDWNAGSLPRVLRDRVPPEVNRHWFAPSWSSIRTIAELTALRTSRPAALEAAEGAVGRALLSAISPFSLDGTLNSESRQVARAISRFLAPEAD